MTAVLPSQRRRQDDDAGDLRGLPQAAPGRVRVLGLDPVRERQQQLLPRIGVMLQAGAPGAGACPGDARASPACTPTRSTPRCWPTDWAGRLRADAVPPPQRRPAAKGASAWRWRSSAARIVFVDEPTAGMDPQARRTTWALLEELRGDGVTVVLTTHYMDEAERLADHIHIIDRGRLIASGSPLSDPRRHPRDDPAGRDPAPLARPTRCVARRRDRV